MEKTEKNYKDLLIQKPIEFEILIDNQNLFQKIFKIEKRTYKIKPLVLNDYNKIAFILDDCKEIFEQKKDDDILVNSISAINKYQKQILEIISIFLNEKISFLKKNLTSIELQKLLFKIIEFNNFNQFFFILNSLKMTMPVRQAEN